MIDIANREYGHLPRLEFINESIAEFSKNRPNIKFDVAISNMSLITIPNLERAIKAISLVVSLGGVFAFSITHPCFYNQYRKYQSADIFQYHVPHVQKGRLIISSDPKGLPVPTRHFHRPLQEYFRNLRAASFVIDELVEPFPDSTTEKLYPTPWKVPHFLFVRCIKLSAIQPN